MFGLLQIESVPKNNFEFLCKYVEELAADQCGESRALDGRGGNGDVVGGHSDSHTFG